MLESETAILQMIQESSVDTFETRLSMNQNLTFEFAKNYFAESGLSLTKANMRTLGKLTSEGFTNLALLLSDECPIIC